MLAICLTDISTLQRGKFAHRHINVRYSGLSLGRVVSTWNRSERHDASAKKILELLCHNPDNDGPWWARMTFPEDDLLSKKDLDPEEVSPSSSSSSPSSSSSGSTEDPALSEAVPQGSSSSAQQPAHQADDTLPDAPFAPIEPADPLIGQTIGGHYRIVSCLGQGGMGTVYKAWHNLLEKLVAVKMLHLHRTLDRRFMLRFQQEAQTLSALDDPHIVRIYEFGLHRGEQPFLVMEYLEGAPLSDLIESSGAVGFQHTLAIVYQACLALQHAHEKGVVHRDLKPSNIMLLKAADGGEVVKVVDFGIAKLDDLDGRTPLKVTQTGEIFGSPYYMSPEQCQGGKLDQRSDIYSLGCLFYECLSGQAPFDGASMFEVVHKQMNDLPEGLARHLSGVPQGSLIEAVVLKCLAKNPEQRYQSMHELAQDIEAIQRSSTLSWFDAARRRFELLRRREDARKRAVSPYVIGLAVVALVTCLATGIAVKMSGIWTGSTPAEPLKQWHQLDVSGQVEFDEGRYAGAQDKFVQALAVAENYTGSAREKMLVASLQELSDLYHVQGEVAKSAEIDRRLAGAKQAEERHWLSLSRQLDSDLDARLAAPQAGGKDMAQTHAQLKRLCETANDLCVQLSSEKLLDPSSQLLDKVIRLLKESQGGQSGLLGRSLVNRGSVYVEKGNRQAAADCYKQAAGIIAPASDLSSLDKAILLRKSSEFFRQQGDLVAAENLAGQSLEFSRSGGQSQDVETSRCYTQLAAICMGRKSFRDASNYASLATAIMKTQSAAPPEDRSRLRLILARLFVANRKYETAQQQALIGLREIERSGHPREQSLIVALESLASYDERIPSLAACREPLLRRALAISRRLGQSATSGLSQKLMDRLAGAKSPSTP